MLPLLLLLSRRQKEKLDKLKKKRDSCCKQSGYVFTLPDRFCDVVPVSPPSVRSHDLATDTGWWAIFYQTKLHSVTTDWDAVVSEHPPSTTTCFFKQL